MSWTPPPYTMYPPGSFDYIRTDLLTKEQLQECDEYWEALAQAGLLDDPEAEETP